jgi:general stress protein YciG
MGGNGIMTGKSKRGFASMDPDRQKEIASKGGRAAHAKGTAHEWSKDEARAAGRKGGVIVSRDREHMSAIGREGGEARGRANALARAASEGGNGRRYVERESRLATGRDAEVATERPSILDTSSLEAEFRR